MLIKFTYVNAITGVSMIDAPCVNGPVLPALAGIAIDFSNESEWPCDVPIFYGHCAAGSDPTSPGVIDVLTQEVFDAARLAETSRRAVILNDRIMQDVQNRLDTFARTRTYDGILSAATYATSCIPRLAAEGQYAANARDNTWETLYTILGEVQSGQRPMPAGYSDIEPLLPALAWPVAL